MQFEPITNYMPPEQPFKAPSPLLPSLLEQGHLRMENNRTFGVSREVRSEERQVDISIHLKYIAKEREAVHEKKEFRMRNNDTLEVRIDERHEEYLKKEYIGVPTTQSN